MLNSIVQERGLVPFPAHTSERVYMREIRKAAPLPAALSRWQDTVDSMLVGVDTEGPIYLMIDQGVVKAGNAHRRPGVHIDGYWIPSIQAHGDGKHMAGGWDTGDGRWKNSPGSGWDTGGGWKTGIYSAPEALILASSISAARAFAGQFDGRPGEGGDCSHVDTSALLEVPMRAGVAYAGNVTMLHESLPIATDCLRTVVRLSVPGWSPELH